MSQKRRLPALSEYPVYDTLTAVAIVCVHGWFLQRWFDPLGGLTPSDRQSIYVSGATVIAIVAGLTAIGFGNSGDGPRAQALTRLYGDELRRNWRALIVLGALASTSCVLAQIIEANQHPWARFVFEFAGIWTLLRVLRLVWLVDAQAGIEDADELAPGRAVAPTVSAEFKSRMGQAS